MLTRKFAFEKASGILVFEMIDVLMSTFSGARFLREQAGSILAQSFTDFRLMIRDDGSVDDTASAAAEIAESDPRVVIVNDGLGGLGPQRSFMRLVEISDAPYFALADQDDVWLPDKIERTFARLIELEAQNGSDMPLLVFTDLKVVDENLSVIDDSMWHYQRLDPTITRDWRGLLAQNVVTGCTIIGNRALAKVALPFALPEMMHDHWLAVNAAKYGRVAYLKDATVLYRQHGTNVAGGIRFGAGYAASKTAGVGDRWRFYRRAAEHFGGVSAAGLFKRKLSLNLRRFHT